MPLKHCFLNMWLLKPAGYQSSSLLHSPIIAITATTLTILSLFWNGLGGMIWYFIDTGLNQGRGIQVMSEYRCLSWDPLIRWKQSILFLYTRVYFFCPMDDDNHSFSGCFYFATLFVPQPISISAIKRFIRKQSPKDEVISMDWKACFTNYWFKSILHLVRKRCFVYIAVGHTKVYWSPAVVSRFDTLLSKYTFASSRQIPI